METNDKTKKRRPLWKRVLMWTGGSVAGLIALVIVLVAVFTPGSEERSSNAAIDAYRAERAHYVDLREAVKWGTLNDVKDAAEDGGDFDARDGLGETALHWVARNTKDPKEITRLVLKHVDDINVRDDAGKTPLHTAAESINASVAEVLSKEGADPCLRDDHGMTPFGRATHPQALRTLNRLYPNVDCN